jgi:hypothetical protein
MTDYTAISFTMGSPNDRPNQDQQRHHTICRPWRAAGAVECPPSPKMITCRVYGIASCRRPSSRRPAFALFFVVNVDPHCLKKNGTPAALH